ncbi:uncharacterized protein LOC141633031 [Silene latifolia]|uniref:uncharacterized protein LOC141633031 n=1 Tax=Silene latifolia TaxID=37657 RepID=UPI003D77D11E
MWSIDPKFKKIVHQSWNCQINGTPMFKLVTKLKNLKKPLRMLNRNGFSDIGKTVVVAKALFEELRLAMHANPTDLGLLAAETDATESYRQPCKMHHSFLSQKGKADWLSHGDENSKFFHSQIRARQGHNRVMSIHGLNDLLYSTCPEGAFLDYYKSLLGSYMPIRLSMCLLLGKGSYLLWNITLYSWETVGGDVTAAFKDFFQTGQLLKQVNTSTFTLIPKTSNPASVLEFHPIACCNTINKVLAKVLCNRLGKVLPDIVSENQGGFVQGRNIVENVLICQDLVRLYNRKAASPRCLIIIDLKKAYDSVQWEFLHQMLYALKFHRHFIDLVLACVTSPSYSLSVNGNNFSFFKGKRGLRQEDPLSPLLFTLCMEYLSRIHAIVAQQEDFRFHPLCGPTRLNHLLFADDLLLFCKGTDSSIMWMLRAFAAFCVASGLCLNKNKYEIYYNGVKTDTLDAILQVSGFHRGTLPFRYLGNPLSSKKLTMNEWMKIIDRIVARIRGWGTKHLSYAGGGLDDARPYKKKARKRAKGGGHYAVISCYSSVDAMVWRPKVKLMDAEGTSFSQQPCRGPLITSSIWTVWATAYRVKGVDIWTIALLAFSSPLWKKIMFTRDHYIQQVGGVSQAQRFFYASTTHHKLHMKKCYQHFRKQQFTLYWTKALQDIVVMPRHRFITVLAMQHGLSTIDNIYKRGYCIPNRSSLCFKACESQLHLFFKCEFSGQGMEEEVGPLRFGSSGL